MKTTVHCRHTTFNISVRLSVHLFRVFVWLYDLWLDMIFCKTYPLIITANGEEDSSFRLLAIKVACTDGCSNFICQTCFFEFPYPFNKLLLMIAIIICIHKEMFKVNRWEKWQSQTSQRSRQNMFVGRIMVSENEKYIKAMIPLASLIFS